MFELTSEFGEIYEGHIIRINKEKLVLLLASTHHSDIKLAQSEDDPANLDAKIDQVYIYIYIYIYLYIISAKIRD